MMKIAAKLHRTLALSSPTGGFTLVELLLVVTLLAFMGSILYGSLSGIIRSRNLIDQHRRNDQIGRFVIGKLSHELLNRLAEPLTRTQSSEGEETPRSSLSSFMIGKRSEGTEGNRDSLRFLCSQGALAVIGGKANYGVVEIEYRLEEPKGKRFTGDLTQETSNPTGLVLIREELPAGLRDKKLIEESRSSVAIADGISSLQFRYYFGGKWLNQWSAGQTKLPDAVEITLEVDSSGKSKSVYRTAVFTGADTNRRRREQSSAQ